MMNLTNGIMYNQKELDNYMRRKIKNLVNKSPGSASSIQAKFPKISG